MEEARVRGRSGVVVAMRVIITVLLVCLGCALAISEQQRRGGGVRQQRTIEEEVERSDQVGRGSRDRRALGILLQGLMEALGYTALGPVRFASIPNPTPAAAQTPVPSLLPPPPGMLQRNNSTGAGPSPPPAAAARETLRLTGVLNFGNNANASNLMNHLAQYERIFHGSGTSPMTSTTLMTTTTARPSTSSSSSSSSPSSQQPLLVKIPIPHRSHQTTSSYHDDDDDEDEGSSSSSSSSEESSGEYRESSAESTESGEADGVELSPPPPPPPSKPKMSVEREYRKQQKVVSFATEDREVNDLPPPHPQSSGGADSRYNHEMYVGEPDWKQRHEEQAYQLAAKNEALAAELAEKNAEREQQCYGERQELADNHDEGDGDDDSREVERPGGKILLEQRKRLNNPLANRLESREPAVKLQDSYGKSLVKADGKMDERIAAYLGMFKNPRTGVYDPGMIETYEHARKYGELEQQEKELEERPPPSKKEAKQSDLRPESKYEEYVVSNKLTNKRRPPRKYWPPPDPSSSPLNEFKRNSQRLSLDTIEGTPTTEASLAKYYDGFLDYGPYYAAIDDQFYRPPSPLPPPLPPPLPTTTTTTRTRTKTRTRTTRNNGDVDRVVARLASYNNSFIKQFEGTTTTTSVVDPAFANTLPQPERPGPIARDFLDDFRSWPQPYTNVYLNDDGSKDFQREKSQILAAEDTATSRPSVRQVLYKPSAPTCKDGNGERSQSRIQDSRSDRIRGLNSSGVRGRAESCREDRRAKRVEGKTTTGQVNSVKLADGLV